MKTKKIYGTAAINFLEKTLSYSQYIIKHKSCNITPFTNVNVISMMPKICYF